MAETHFRVPYGDGELAFRLPAGMRAGAIQPRSVEPLGGLECAVTAALAGPLGSAPLRELARAGDRACIVFTDGARAVPDHVLVPELLRELRAAGVREEDITLLCGVGMHRPSTAEEKISKLGTKIVARYRVVDHRPGDWELLGDLGTWEGVPLLVNRLAAEADLLLAMGWSNLTSSLDTQGARRHWLLALEANPPSPRRMGPPCSIIAVRGWVRLRGIVFIRSSPSRYVGRICDLC